MEEEERVKKGEEKEWLTSNLILTSYRSLAIPRTKEYVLFVTAAR